MQGARSHTNLHLNIWSALATEHHSIPLSLVRFFQGQLGLRSKVKVAVQGAWVVEASKVLEVFWQEILSKIGQDKPHDNYPFEFR
jgi:hypothetical protein